MTVFVFAECMQAKIIEKHMLVRCLNGGQEINFDRLSLIVKFFFCFSIKGLEYAGRILLAVSNILLGGM